MRWKPVEAKPPVDTHSGLTEEEEKVLDKILEAHSAFKSLDREHPNEEIEWSFGIHQCQSLLQARVMRRTHPKGWVTLKEDTDGK